MHYLIIWLCLFAAALVLSEWIDEDKRKLSPDGRRNWAVMGIIVAGLLITLLDLERIIWTPGNWLMENADGSHDPVPLPAFVVGPARSMVIGGLVAYLSILLGNFIYQKSRKPTSASWEDRNFTNL